MHSIKDIVKQLIGKSLDAYNTKYTKVLNTRIDNIVAQAGNDNTEIVDARIDSAGVTHTTLNNRILAETKMNDEQLIEYTGNNISAEDTTQGYLKDVEILGNTIQNEEDLADIKSVGKLQEDGTYKMSILSCGKNLFDDDLIYNESKFIPQTTVSVLEGKNVLIGNPNLVVWKNYNDVYLGSQKLKVKQNTSYVLSYKLKSDVNSSGFRGVAFYDSRLNFISKTETKKTRTNNWTVCTISFTTPSNCKYLGFYEWDGGSKVYIDIDTIQLEEGTVATPYEPYQENKCDILLPCQLEKVGDVSDRLYYDDVEKDWCIEKNIETVILDGSESSWTEQSRTEWKRFVILNLKHMDTEYDYRNPNKTLCDRFTYDVDDIKSDLTYLKIYDGVGFYKNDIANLSDFKTWLGTNNIMLKYIRTSPQKIVLPLSTQIVLNSFFGTTHVYMESGEVEGTIKCKIPKSLGATVQTLNNKTDILSDRIEVIEGLKDSQNMKYETDKGYLVCKETKNGVIDDLKIEGKTLVNLSTLKDKTLLNASNDERRLDFNTSMFKASTDYTLIMNVGNVANATRSLFIQWDFIDDSASKFNTISNVSSLANSTVVFKFRQDILPSKLKRVYLSLHIDDSTSCTCEIKDCIVLEGDHTQNPPSYFEGLMSVGQDVDKIEVLSRKEDGNLLDIKEVKGFFGSSPSYNEGIITGGYGIEIHPNNLFLTKGTYIFSFELDRKTDSVVDYYTIAFCGYNSENILGNIVINTLNNGICTKTIIIDRDINVKYIKFDCRSQRTNTTVSNICLSKTSNHTYTPHQSNKKQILFYNENGELEPIQELHEWDSIEKHSDNKWYYHKRSGKVVLNGSESNWNVNTQTDTTMRFEINMVSKNMAGNRNPIICDKFNLLFNYELNCVEEGVFTSIAGSTLFLNISKSKLSSLDVEGLKQWLQDNNVTVVYQLAEEEVYELAPLHLDSYANETLILCNSGAISPKMEFSITSHINELVKAYGERINLLEEKVYKYMVTQNRMQLASTYSADSVTFKVDYFSLCGDEENYDEDLYNLILNNILVGKDNYNYDKMFTMILDYASWNQISWEQFDILVGLMDMQHNPPVEEEITEDESMEETPVE